MVDSVARLPVEISQLQGETDIFSKVPEWSLWLSTVVLSLAFIIGLPLNGATVLIFWRRKQLRHLINFVLLLDCLSHAVLCLICIPIQLVNVWSGRIFSSAGLKGLIPLQQVVANFSNVYSTFLTVSIAILRYRRLCWKKKDKFSTSNAIKWSMSSGLIAIVLIFAQSYSSYLSNDQNVTLIFHMITLSLIFLSMVIVFFCYIRLSQKVWFKTANHEKVMDPLKLKKSRSVHLRATIHSCVQIILIILTLSPHLYQQTMEALYATTAQFAQVIQEPNGGTENASFGSFSSGQPYMEYESSTVQSSSYGGYVMDDAPIVERIEESEDWSMGIGSMQYHHQNPVVQDNNSSPVSKSLSTSNSHFLSLIAITINYTLLILGTPMAYIASCHRFREQFTSILFSNMINTPPNSAGPNPNSPRHAQQKNGSSNSSNTRTFKSHHRSSSPLQGRFYSTTFSRASSHPFSSSLTKTTTTNGNFSGITRNSISISTNNVSMPLVKSRSMGGSIRSNKSSMKRVTSTRRKSSRGILAADFIKMDSDSTAMLQEQDLSNSNSINAKETPTPSPTMTETCEVGVERSDSHTSSTRSSSCCNNVPRRSSVFCTNTQSAFLTTTIDANNKMNMQTMLHNYDYDFSDVGELV